MMNKDTKSKVTQAGNLWLLYSQPLSGIGREVGRS